MHGNGVCPFTANLLPCRMDGDKLPCSKTQPSPKACELWDEYAQECAINLIVRLLRNIEMRVENNVREI